MRLRPYNKNDFVYLREWVADARTHALWCAGRLPFPLTEESFQDMLETSEREWGSCGYAFTEDSGQPVGFLLYNINEEENYGFASYIVVDSSLRGKGYGAQMLKLLLHYAFFITNVAEVRLNVFDANEPAKRCYEKAGFSEVAFTPGTFMHEKELWGRLLMRAERSP